MSSYKNMLVNDTTPFAIAEAFKEIRTNMLYTARDVSCPVYAVTSGFAHEGKSVVVANLAASFANLGKRVLLLDADLRNPALHKIFAMDRSVGVSEIAAGIVKDYASAIASSSIEGLDVVPAGHIPPNPSELLASTCFSDFVSAMQGQYDAIFVDFPPAGIVVDALIPASMITGYAVVVRSARSDRRVLSQILSSLEGVGAKVLGLILNDIDPKEGSYGKGERGRYRYRYKYNYSYTRPEKRD